MKSSLSGIAVVLAAVLAACAPQQQETGSATMSVRSSALYAVDGGVDVKAFNGLDKTWDSASPFFHEVVNGTAGIWKHAFDNLATGDYTFCATTTYNGMVFGPGCMNATVTKNHMATIDIVLQQQGNSDVTVDSPFISGISLSDGAPHYDEAVLMAASVTDKTTDPSLLTYAWSATCDGNPVTGFVPDNAASTTFKPACKGTASITLKVSDGQIDSSVTFPLTFRPEGADVTVTLNRFPAVSPFIVSQGQVPVGESSTITLPATDDESLTWTWTTCSGNSMSAPVTNDPTNYFHASAAGDCRVTVAVSDGLGGVSTRSVILHVGNSVNMTQPVFNNLPEVLPGNVPSLGFQATQTAEFGDYISLAGTGRHLTKATVLMSAWAKRSDWPSVGTDAGFTHPITINIYNANDLLNPIATKTSTFVIPWRPEAAGGTCGGAWQASDGTCYNGFAFTISFDLDVVVPDSFSYGIAYNTQTWGKNPLNVDGPYTSLNVGLVSAPPSVGTDPNPDAVLWNTHTAAWYADNGAGGVDTFRTDTGWTGLTPAVEFFAY